MAPLHPADQRGTLHGAHRPASAGDPACSTRDGADCPRVSERSQLQPVAAACLQQPEGPQPVKPANLLLPDGVPVMRHPPPARVGVGQGLVSDLRQPAARLHSLGQPKRCLPSGGHAKVLLFLPATLPGTRFFLGGCQQTPASAVPLHARRHLKKSPSLRQHPLGSLALPNRCAAR